MIDSMDRSASAGRSVGVMVAWYAAALLPLAVWLRLESAGPLVDTAQPCTGKTVMCWQSTPAELVLTVLVWVLPCSVVMSSITLAYMVRWAKNAVAVGTTAAITGWFTGPVVLLTLGAVVATVSELSG